jgi:hypothetical protein
MNNSNIDDNMSVLLTDNGGKDMTVEEIENEIHRILYMYAEELRKDIRQVLQNCHGKVQRRK